MVAKVKTPASLIGKKIQIPLGAVVRTQGTSSKRTARTTQATVRTAVATRNGKIRVSWISMGYVASTLINA